MHVSRLARTNRACPCCCGTDHAAVFDNRMAPIGGLDMSYRVDRCAHCGFLYAGELPTSDCYAHYYQTLSKYDQISSATQIPDVDVVRAEATVALCARHIARDQGIADLGCGVGYLLHVFHKAGWQTLHGIDPAPLAPQRARDLFGLTNIQSGLLVDAAVRLPLSRIGLVCMTGVLEHLWSPRDDLNRLFAACKPGTYVFIEVPALERFERPPCEPYGEFSLEHIQYFSAQSLQYLMQAAGATTICINFLDLAPAATGSLLGLFRIGNENQFVAPPISDTTDGDRLRTYLDISSRSLERAIVNLAASPGPWILYGAGSHTARLLPILTERGLDQHIANIIDGNTNLHGQQLGRWIVASSDLLNIHSNTTVAISSFRAQTDIYRALSTRHSNPLLCLYPTQDVP